MQLCSRQHLGAPLQPAARRVSRQDQSLPSLQTSQSKLLQRLCRACRLQQNATLPVGLGRRRMALTLAGEPWGKPAGPPHGSNHCRAAQAPATAQLGAQRIAWHNGSARLLLSSCGHAGMAAGTCAGWARSWHWSLWVSCRPLVPACVLGLQALLTRRCSPSCSATALAGDSHAERSSAGLLMRDVWRYKYQDTVLVQGNVPLNRCGPASGRGLCALSSWQQACSSHRGLCEQPGQPPPCARASS